MPPLPWTALRRALEPTLETALSAALSAAPGARPPTPSWTLPWAVPWALASVWTRFALRWLAFHSGLPVIAVAAIALVVGYRLLKKSAGFVLEVAVVGMLLFAAAEAGWIRW